ncbi:MAG TPA: ligase-associated DNA damage response endonuclease PdeM [Hyphomicrobiales bacterium]|nr:ligase-associated DNA damage response endonuclease PdeM [Hyphomicrobiales bacterium]
MTTSAARLGEIQPAPVLVAGAALLLDPAGAVWWADAETLIVADLHLEKGSALAGRGRLLPPYDTTATLAALASLVARYRPRRVVALGDSFHDAGGPERLAIGERERLAGLVAGREWIWIEGNHDGAAASGLGGISTDVAEIGPLSFRHEPRPGDAPGSLAGHLHPAAKVRVRGMSFRRRCFAVDRDRVVLPAFGAYTGGLNVLDAAFRGLFSPTGFRAFLIGSETVHAVPLAGLVRD